MERDRIAGLIIVPTSLAALCVYFWLVFFAAPLLVVQITAFVAVAAVVIVVAWIGVVLATTPPSKSDEEIEKELEEELKRVEARERSGSEQG